MINKYSSPSNFSNQIVDNMDQALRAESKKFSFAELTSVLVKCADQLDNTDDKLVDEVDGVLSFIEIEFMK
jgi:hypothetical protein